MQRIKLQTRDINEALEAGGLDFKVGLRDVMGVMTDADCPDLSGTVFDLKGVSCLINESTGEPIGESANVVVGSRYHPISNREGFGLAEGLAEHGGIIKEVRSWDGGKYSDMTIEFDGLVGPDGNQLQKEITVRVPHDGKSSVLAQIWAWRLICSNGMEGWKKDSIVRVRHTRNYRSRLEEAGRVLKLAERYYETFQKHIHTLHRAQRTPAQVMVLLNKLVPDNPEAKNHTRTQNIRQDMFVRHQYGMGNKGQSLYDLYNGITEYVDHKNDRKADRQGKDRISAMYGAGAQLKRNAFELLLEDASV